MVSPTWVASSASDGQASDLPSVVITTGTSSGPRPAACSSRAALRLVRHVPAVRHHVPGQEVAQRVRPRRPTVPDQPHVGHRPVRRLDPRVQQRVDHRVELLLRRVPRLEQVVVQVDDVDRLDRGVGVGVGGEQDPARERHQIHRLLQELDAVHLGHPVVGEQQRHLVAAQLHLTDRLQRLGTGVGPHDPVRLPVLPAQVPGHRPGHGRIVINRQYRRFRHTPIQHRRPAFPNGHAPRTGAPGLGCIVPSSDAHTVCGSIPPSQGGIEPQPAVMRPNRAPQVGLGRSR